MGKGRRLPELILTIEERDRLTEWTRRRVSALALALRARIVLACAIETVGRFCTRINDSEH